MSYSPYDTETIRRLTRELSEARKKNNLLTEEVKELKAQNTYLRIEKTDWFKRLFAS